MQESIINWLREITKVLTNANSSTGITKTIAGFNPALYGYVTTIMEAVVKPAAYAVLACFFLMELFQVSQKAEGAGGGSMLGVRLVAKSMIKMVVCKTLIESTSLILETIYNASLEITNGIAGVVGGTDASSAFGIDDKLIAQVNDLSLMESIGPFLITFIVYAAVWATNIIVKVIVLGRFVEIYIYMALAPIPIATFAGEELSLVAKSFLKNFVAVCLQGAIIYLVLSFFPALVSGISSSNATLTESLWQMLLYTAILIISVTSAGKVSKSICNAM